MSSSSPHISKGIKRSNSGAIHLTEQHLPGVLNVLLDLDKEGDSLPAVEESVVVCEGEVHHLCRVSSCFVSRIWV